MRAKKRVGKSGVRERAGAPRPNREIREQSLFLSVRKQTLSCLETRRRLKMRFLWPNSRRGPWHVLSAQSRGPQKPRQFEPCDRHGNTTEWPRIGLRRWRGRECREKTRGEWEEWRRTESGGVYELACFVETREIYDQTETLRVAAWRECFCWSFCCSALKVVKERFK